MKPLVAGARGVQRQPAMTWHTRDVAVLQRTFTVTSTVAYVDTIRLFYRGMFPRDQLSWLRARFGRRMIVESWKAPGDTFRGGFITLHQPDVETLERLSAIPKPPFVVNAVHIAVDFICPDQEQAKLAAAFLGRAVVQKWHRRKHSSHRERNTHYWRARQVDAEYCRIRRPRILKPAGHPAAMSRCDLPSADACRRAGLDLNNLLDGPDVLGLLNSQARIAPIDPKKLDRAIERKARRCLPGTQRRYGSKITVDELKTKIRRLLTRILQDEDSSFDEQTIDQARSQFLFDYRPELRSSLDEIPWSEFAPPVRWHAWR